MRPKKPRRDDLRPKNRLVGKAAGTSILTAVVKVRPACPEDAQRVAQIHVASWREAYRELLPADFLAALDPEPNRKWRVARLARLPPRTAMLVVEAEADLTGFADIGPSRDGDAHPEATGEVYAIYLDPSHWGKGMGRALMTAATAELSGFGFGEATLWVLEGNSRARGFYEAAGWAWDDGARTELIGTIAAAEIRYRRQLS